MVQECTRCALEALLEVQTYLIEASKGRSPEEIRERCRLIIRECRHAENHILEKYPEIAEKIRSFRKLFDKCYWSPEPPTKEHIPKEAFKILDNLIIEVTKKGIEEAKQETCPTCFVEVKLTTSNPNPTKEKKINILNTKNITEGGRMVSYKDTGIVYVGAHVGKAIGRAALELDKQMGAVGKAPHERPSTWVNIAGAVAAPVLLYMGKVPSPWDMAVLVMGAEMSTKIQDYVEEYMGGMTSRFFKPLPQRQPAAALPLGETETWIPRTPPKIG